MKKLFTIDDFAVAFISAMGYGFGYTIPMHLGWPDMAILLAEVQSILCYTATVLYPAILTLYLSALIIVLAFSDLSIFQRFRAGMPALMP